MRQVGIRHLIISLLTLVLTHCASASAVLEPTLVAATRTLIPTRTTQPTPTSTTTPNWAPIIPPLTEHEWMPEPVLISFGQFAGDGVRSGPPELTLLSNGTLYIYESGGLYETQLEREEVCSLLNTIDQTGFFVYDPRVINTDRMGDGAGGGYVNVDAWQSQHFGLMMLSQYVNGEVEDEGYYMPPILPPIVETYRLLDSYRPINLEQADFVYYLQIREVDPDWATDLRPWPSGLFSVAEFYEGSGCVHHNVTRMLTPSELLVLKELDNGRINTYVEENGRIFNIAINAYFPEQVVATCSANPDIPTEFVVPDLPETLQCSPEDGVLPIP